MSYAHTAVLGAIAFSATFGAVQFAAGSDLAGGLRVFSDSWESGVNRSAKADRAGPTVAAAAPTRTIAIQLEKIANTSIVIRIPQRREALDAEPGKRPVACEPVVSVLTEIAKRLQPGRCVT
jgi:hypothetical protein